MERSKTIQTWFKQEIYLWRLCGCILWSVIVQIIASLILSVLLHANLFHPLQWLKDGASQILTLATLSLEVCLNLLLIILVLMYSLHYTVVPVVFVTRMEIVWKLLNPFTLVVLFLYSASGGLFVRLFLAMGDEYYSGLTHSCFNDNSKQCLNECHLILVLYGTFIGLLYGVSIVFGNENCIVFPIIQQSKFFQIKVGLSQKLKESCIFIFRRTKWFILFYVLFGLSLQNWITNLLHLNLSTISVQSHVWNLLSIKLWCTAVLTGTVTHFLLCLVAFLFRVFQTECVSFCINGQFEENQYRTLSKAISCMDLPLLQHISYLDLNIAVQHSKDRRQELFSISQPGGHPHNWNAITKECLTQIKLVTSSLVAIYEPPVISKQISSSHLLDDAVQQARSPMGPEYERWRAHTFYPGTQTSPTTHAANSADDASFQSPLQPFLMIVKSYFEKKMNLLWVAFFNMPIIAYFIKEMPEGRIRRAFARSELCIWAIEALSFLAAASFYEDRYGVCQKDLGAILGTILNLHQAINKIQKLEIPVSKWTAAGLNIDHDIALKQSLKCTIKTAIYRMTAVFKEHIRSVDLSVDHCRLLNRYLEFLE